MRVCDLIPVLREIDDPVAGPVAAPERIDRIGLGCLSLDRETPTLSGGARAGG